MDLVGTPPVAISKEATEEKDVISILSPNSQVFHIIDKIIIVSDVLKVVERGLDTDSEREAFQKSVVDMFTHLDQVLDRKVAEFDDKVWQMNLVETPPVAINNKYQKKKLKKQERKMREEKAKEASGEKISEIMAKLKYWTEVLREHAHTLPDVKDPELVVAELKAELIPFLDMARETAQKSSLVEQTMIRGAIAQMFSTYHIKIALNRLQVYDTKTLKVKNEEAGPL